MSRIKEQGRKGTYELYGTNFIDDVPLAPERHVEELELFPLDAAAASYVFSILEEVGNKVANIVLPGAIRERSAWHGKVYGQHDEIRKASLW